MERRRRREKARAPDGRPATSFPEWVVREVERLLEARAGARSSEERADFDLKLAVIYGAAERYGRSLVEVSEL
jgi:hypothetical protein